MPSLSLPSYQKSNAFARFPVTALLLFAVTLSSGQALGITPPHLSQSIDQIVSDANLGNAAIACYMLDLQNRDNPLVDMDADRMMIPASNLKLITSGSTLLVLGPEFSFETGMRYDGRRLVIVGSGDPGLGDPELLDQMNMTIESLTDVWVEDVVKAGIKHLDELVIDDRIFDDEFVHPTWERDDLLKDYGAEVSGFNYFGNCLAFYVWPARAAGAAPTYRVEPDVSEWFSFRNLATTSSDAKVSNSLYVQRDPLDSNNFALRGIVKQPQAAPIRVTVHDPAEFFAQLFAARLRKKGVEVKTARSADENDPYPMPGEAIGRPIRTPITTALARCDQDSDNLYAESFIKRIGHEITNQPGSWGNGTSVARMLLSKHLGPNLAMEMDMLDGSGLSRKDRIAPHVIGQWLAFMHDMPQIGPMFINSLAMGGESGTLRNRFGDIDLKGEVHAKSGYMSGVSCLSGYVLGADGRTIVFSIMCNDLDQTQIRPAKKMQERMVGAIDAYLDAIRTTPVARDHSKEDANMSSANKPGG